jgi:hypothetical protein
VSRATDQVGYREFSPEPPVDEGIVPPPPPPEHTDDITQPWPVATTVDEDRRRRGRLYSRLIFALGVLILAFAAWRIFA